jgi:integrase
VRGRVPNTLSFYEVDEQWLNKYENYMLNVKKSSRTTVSMYVRVLRTLFNKAIREKEIESSTYPFGKDKYVVPASKNPKKALAGNQLKSLLSTEAGNAEQEKAKDFWFFSFICNGMNMKDIALLRYKDYDGGTLTYVRAKMFNTSKGNAKTIVVTLTDFAKSIIEKYGAQNKYP